MRLSSPLEPFSAHSVVRLSAPLLRCELSSEVPPFAHCTATPEGCLEVRQGYAFFCVPWRENGIKIRTPEGGCLKSGKCRFAAAPAEAGAYVGQQVVGIGFSRSVREAQVSGLLKHPLMGCEESSPPLRGAVVRPV